jgi:peptide/nickel transport system ATP-binding protein
MEPTVLRVEALSLRFPTIRGDARVLSEVSFDIRRGETFGLVGETGCGKSVTAKTILGLIDRPPAKITGGRVWYASGQGTSREVRWRELLTLREPDLARIRGNEISMVFQDPMTSLNPVLKAGDQIAEPFLIHRRESLIRDVLHRLEVTEALRSRGTPCRKIRAADRYLCSNCETPSLVGILFCRTCNGYFEKGPFTLFRRTRMRVLRRVLKRALTGESRTLRRLAKLVFLSYETLLRDEARGRAIDLIASVRIADPDRTAERYPHELSGGMQQRVAIAMSLACRPSLLVADEPTTALDVTIQAQILNLLSELKDAMGMSVLLITHNLGIVAEHCSRVAVMYAGSIAEIADVGAIFAHPLHPYTQGLIRSIPVPGEHREELHVIPGRLPDPVHPPSGCRFRTRCPEAFERCSAEVPKLQEFEPRHWVACHLYTTGGDDA